MTRPVQVQGVANAVAIRLMGYTSLALTADGQVWTWGASGRQEQPTGTAAPMPEAQDPARLGESGGSTAAVILRDGRVLAWGSNYRQQISQDPSAPLEFKLVTEATALKGASIVSFGGENGYAVFPDGEVWGWGDNQWGDVGNGRMVKSHYFEDFLVGTDVVPTLSEGNVLRAARAGVDVALSYPGSKALLRRIYRDESKLGIATTRIPPDTAAASYQDRGAVSAPASYFYALRAVSPCSHTEGP